MNYIIALKSNNHPKCYKFKMKYNNIDLILQKWD